MDSPENYKNRNYKIVADSCCEFPVSFRGDSRFQNIPMILYVGDETIIDDESFDQKSFLKKVAECPECPKSACPSPESYREAYRTDAERVYCLTISSKLSGSYNSANLGMHLYHEKYGDKKIHVFDSESTSVGETQLFSLIVRLEEKGYPFEDIVEIVESFRDGMQTLFVLDNLETLRKNGRLTGIKAIIASTLNIKPLMKSDHGSIAQKAQAIGVKKALGKLAEAVHTEIEDKECKSLMISHCNAPEKAELVRDLILAKDKFHEVIIMDTQGLNSTYANDGGIIVTV
ncbi:MAG: DegV family protein [Lachnospiraceae bacterium]|nr:DegV family protein [Lachnospiraceae bacterium]